MVQGNLLKMLVGGLAAIQAVAAPAWPTRPSPRPKRIVLIAGTKSHPPGQHEYGAGCRLLKKCLDKVKGVQAVVHLSGWPEDPKALEGADAVFLYTDGGGGHPAIQGERLKTLGALMRRGVGLGAAHWGVEVPPERGGAEFTRWLGGYYETGFSANPFWEARFDRFPRHPITRGVRPFALADEWYFNIRFRPAMRGVVPLLVARPSDAVRRGPYAAPPGPFEHIVQASGREEVLMWATERPDGGRGFGFTGGHFHRNWGNDNFRKLVLNALLWIAKVRVPRDGVPSTVSEADLSAGPDSKG